MGDFIRKVRRLQFWIICPIVVVLGLVGWFLTTGTLTKERQKNVSSINGSFTKVNEVNGKQNHPNDTIAAEMDRLLEKRRGEVAAGWSEKYQQQTKEGGVLTWPSELGETFVAKVRNLRPIEKTVPYPVVNEPLLISERRRYRDYIQEELPKLAETIQSIWSPASGGRMANSFSDTSFGEKAIVVWSPTNQAELAETHFDWSGQGGRFGGGGERGGPRMGRTDDAPNVLEILYAQEDLWILRAVMQIIARANSEASGRFNAAVKEIEYIRIGERAIQGTARITRIAEMQAAVGPGPMGDGMAGGYEAGPPGGGGERAGPPEGYGERAGPPDGYGAEGGMRDGMPGGEGRSQPDPANGRYVKLDYTELDAESLRRVMTEPTGVSPEEAYLAVAKRAPVRMRLKVDQRQLHRLLVECANSELTLEVRQLRVNPKADMGGMDAMGGGRGRRGMYSEGGARGGEFSMRPGGGSSGLSAASLERLFSYELDVEIYGIIYIYNPVDRKILGYEDAAEETPPADESVASI